MLITGEKGQRIQAGVWKVLLHLANAIRPAHGLDGWTGSSHGQRENRVPAAGGRCLLFATIVASVVLLMHLICNGPSWVAIHDQWDSNAKVVAFSTSSLTSSKMFVGLLTITVQSHANREMA